MVGGSGTSVSLHVTEAKLKRIPDGHGSDVTKVEALVSENGKTHW